MTRLGDLTEGAISVRFGAVTDFLFDILNDTDIALDTEVFFDFSTSARLLARHRSTICIGNLLGDDGLLGQPGLRLSFEAELVLVFGIEAALLRTAIANFEFGVRDGRDWAW